MNVNEIVTWKNEMHANGTPEYFDVNPNNDMIVFHNKEWGKTGNFCFVAIHNQPFECPRC